MTDEQPLSPGNQALPVHQELTDVKPGSHAIPAIIQVSADEMGVKHKLTRGKASGELGLEPRVRRFDWAKKRMFIRAARRFWPNVTLCCAAVGISDSTFYTHRNQDKIFAHKIAEVERGLTNEVYAMNATEARNPKNFLDRAMYLRAHMPELYNPAKKIIVEGYKMTESEAVRRSAILGEAVDAQIVNAYTTRKERLQAKREGESLLPSGDEGVGRGEGDGKA